MASLFKHALGTLTLAAVFACGGLATAAPITYHVEGDIPAQYQGIEHFVHFTLYGEASGTPLDTATITNFESDGTGYFGSTVGTATGSLPGNVVLVDDDASGNYSVYTQRITLGTTLAFDVTLEGPQLDGTLPANFVDFVLVILQATPPSYPMAMPNEFQFGSVEIYRDATTGSDLAVAANAAFTVTAVPEPTGVVALLGAALGMSLRRCRGRRG